MPAILLQGTLESTTGEHHRRAGNVALFGVGPEFWKFGEGGPKDPPGRDEIVLNEPLAEQLHVGPPRVSPSGSTEFDEVILRIPQAAEVPADSPLGRKTETVRSRRLKSERGHSRFRIGPLWFAADAASAAGCLHGVGDDSANARRRWPR